MYLCVTCFSVLYALLIIPDTCWTLQVDTFMKQYRAGGLNLKDFELDVAGCHKAAEQEQIDRRRNSLKQENRKHARESAAAGVFAEGLDDDQVSPAWPSIRSLSWLRRPGG